MLLFLDIQTTGLEVHDKICSIALIAVDSETTLEMYDIVNEGKKISSQASSVNHIINEMLKEKPRLLECETYQFLQKHNDISAILVAHNSKFALKMLLACGFEFQGKVIDTLRVTKHLIPECEFFSLQFLRYELKLYRNEERLLHNGVDNAKRVKFLYEYLLDVATPDVMCELSQKHVLILKLNFGKYAGHFIEDIGMWDLGYLQWIVANVLDLDEDLRYSIDYFLQGRV